MIASFLKGPILPLSAFVLLVAISLTAAFYPGGEQLVDPDMVIEVQGTWSSSEGPDGLAPSKGKTWQYVDVDLRNKNRDAAIEVSVPHFYARAKGGERVWVHNSEDFNYPAVRPNGNVTVHLVFMVKSGTELTELEYVQRASGPVRCSVPS